MILGLAVSGLLAVSTAPGAPPAPPKPRLDPRLKEVAAWWRERDQSLRRIELYEMLSAIVSAGSQMGPGEGWFHPGQSRYGWKWLAARCGTLSGSITPREFPGPLSLFQRLDRDGNGVLTPDDLDWSDKSPFLKQVSMARTWLGRFDKDSNGRISRQEWDAFFERAAKGKDHLTPDDLRLALFGTAPPPAAKGKQPAGPSAELLLERLFTGELGSPFEGPRVGQRAPDFTLPTHDGKQTYRLSQFYGKPVVLIFGSFT
jgi:hypothetical protein